MAELSRLPHVTLDAYEWQFDGVCRESNPTLFFHPEGERGPSRAKRAAAVIALCSHCPVIRQCRQHGLSAREPYGVWGGLTEEDRLAIHRAEKIRDQAAELPQTA